MIQHVTDATFDAFIHSSEETILLDFSAAWCPPCRILSPILEELSEEIDGLIVGKIDVDENPETTSKFGIMSMPTLLFFRRGEVIGQAVGLRPKQQLVELIEEKMQSVSR